MTSNAKDPSVSSQCQLQRAIVLQLLRDDRSERWSRAELELELGGDAHAVGEALERLAAHGVLCASGQDVWASRPVRRLDELGLIGL